MFGHVANGGMTLNERGRIVQRCWDDLTSHYTGIELDAFVIMPNHVHGIVVITDGAYRRGGVTPPQWDAGNGRGEGTSPRRDVDGDKPGEGTSPRRDVDGDKPGETTSPRRDVDGGKRGETTSPRRDVDGGKRGGVTPPLRDTGYEREPRKHTLGQILAYYKYQTTKIINQTDHSPGRRIWQRNYWEHIIRNDNSYETIRQYVLENPLHWAQDEENPERKSYNAMVINHSLR